MIDYDRIAAVAEELQRYAVLEDTEIGELNRLLTQLIHYVDYASEEFAVALLTEMEEQLQSFQEGAKIVEKVETFTRTFTYLEWE